MEVMAALVPVGGDAGGAVAVKGGHGVGEEPGRLEEIVDAHRHEDVELEVALTGRHAHRHVVGHDLDGHHGHRLTLGGVDLAGHDGGAGLVFRDANFP